MRAPRRSLAAPAPAYRPAGKRGKRGWLAVFATFAALVVLVLAVGSSLPEGGSGGGQDYEYVLDRPGWTGPALVCLVGVLALAAVLLWRARTPAIAALSIALVPLALCAAVLAQLEQEDSGRVSGAALREARKLTSESEVRAALGTPAGSGSIWTSSGLAADCVVYRAAEDPYGGGHGFCFMDGRVVAHFPEPLK